MSHVKFKKCQCRMFLSLKITTSCVFKKQPCRMSLVFLSSLLSMALRRMSNKRNGHFVVSNLVVQIHTCREGLSHLQITSQIGTR